MGGDSSGFERGDSELIGGDTLVEGSDGGVIGGSAVRLAAVELIVGLTVVFLLVREEDLLVRVVLDLARGVDLVREDLVLEDLTVVVREDLGVMEGDDLGIGLVTGVTEMRVLDFDLELDAADFLASLVVSPSIDLFLSIIYNYIMTRLKITKKQQAVLDFLEDFTEENGYSPSYREIRSGLGLSSVSAVAEHIDNMVSKGILKKVPGAARSLEVLDFRHTETVELFKAKLLDASEEERKVLMAAADVLGLDLD